MGTHNSESNCEICGGRSHLVEDSRYDSREEHCLNENCRHYNVDSGTLKEENPLCEELSGGYLECRLTL